MKEQFFNTRCCYICMTISLPESSICSAAWLRYICNCHIKVDRGKKQLQLLSEVVLRSRNGARWNTDIKEDRWRFGWYKKMGIWTQGLRFYSQPEAKPYRSCLLFVGTIKLWERFSTVTGCGSTWNLLRKHLLTKHEKPKRLAWMNFDTAL